jgi:hypothetical protein
VEVVCCNRVHTTRKFAQTCDWQQGRQHRSPARARHRPPPAPPAAATAHTPNCYYSAHALDDCRRSLIELHGAYYRDGLIHVLLEYMDMGSLGDMIHDWRHVTYSETVMAAVLLQVRRRPLPTPSPPLLPPLLQLPPQLPLPPPLQLLLLPSPLPHLGLVPPPLRTPPLLLAAALLGVARPLARW